MNLVDVLNEISSKIGEAETAAASMSDKSLFGIIKAANGRIAAALAHIDGSQTLKDIIAAGGTPGHQPADEPPTNYVGEGPG